MLGKRGVTIGNYGNLGVLKTLTFDCWGRSSRAFLFHFPIFFKFFNSFNPRWIKNNNNNTRGT